MSTKLKVFLGVALGWAAVAGLVLHLTGVDLGSVPGVALITVLYMPSPFVAAVVAERGVVRDRFRLPRGGLRAVAHFLLIPPVVVVGFALAYLAAVYVGGDLLGIDAAGGLATSSQQLIDGAGDLLGQAAVDAAGPPPPFVVLLLASIWGAVLAGWTINAVAAMGEEYGWRGLMWDELKQHGPARANLVTGVVWGLWHAPLIVQGYNFPDQPVVGVLAMVVFCIGMSPVLTAVRERTSSVVPAAAAHGIFNALAAVLLLAAPHADPITAGPLGVLGAALLLFLGVALWRTLPTPGAQRTPAVEGSRP
jgi:membrane protease YdiL (CAAX protease family)